VPDDRDLLVTRFFDEQALGAAGLANVSRNQDYNQVVLVGDGMDTRPFRLPWTAGTVLYLVAPGQRRAEATPPH
jgi:O-methyltransferase involved in polyketide biosynthesis